MNVFVFGSNLAGRHGSGSALEAISQHGAKYGIGVGLVGNSYAIPTKDEHLKILPLDRIKTYVDEFINFAHNTPQNNYKIVSIGCGLAGYKPDQIAPMFKNAPINCSLTKEFELVLK